MSGAGPTHQRPLGPEFEYVNILDSSKTNKYLECIMCGGKFYGSAIRIRGHILGISDRGAGKCKRATKEAIDKMQKLEDEKKISDALKRTSEALDSATSEALAKRSKAHQGSIQEAFSRGNRADVDDAIAQCFYANGLPFDLVRRKSFHRMVDAIRTAPLRYKPPDYNKLREELLQKAKVDVTKSLEPVRESMLKAGVSITSDGWSSVQNRPLLNILACSGGETMFLRAVDTSGQTKDASMIAGILCSMVQELGVEKVVCVITDSAANCKAAGDLITRQYPRITWMPCAAHCIDLVLEDIGKLEWVSTIIEKALNALKFITNHQQPLAIYRKHAHDTEKKLELIKPGETRFGTNFYMLERMEKVKTELELTVTDREWTAWLNNNQKYQGTAKEVKKFVAQEDREWEKIHNLLKVTEPMMELLRLADSPAPTVGKMFARCSKIRELLEDGEGCSLSMTRMKEIHKCFMARWDMLDCPMYGAGYTLDPEFWNHNVSHGVEALMTMVERLLESKADRDAAMVQYSAFRDKKGIWARELCVTSASKMPAHVWWQTYGGGAPQLQQVAVQVLAQPSSACACERSWSNYDFIHSKRRNRLRPGRADDLVYVFSNIRLRDRVQAGDYQANIAQWDESSESELSEDGI